MNLKNALTLAFGVALLGSTAAIKAADAVLVQKSGTVTATLPNGSTKELSQGDTIPEGSTVKTSADGTAFVEPVSGAVATLRGNTSVKIEKIRVSQDSSGTVTKQEVLLDLTSGDLVSTLDPQKRAINDYKVHTPKGVAAARGTDFNLSVSGTDGFSLATTADSVSFTDSTGATYTVSAGQITITTNGHVSAPIPLATAISDPTVGAQVTAALNAAVTATSQIVAQNLGGLSSASATTLLTQIVGVAAAANPTGAAGYAQQAAAAVVSPTSPTASVGTQAAADVAAAAAAAAPAQAASIAGSVAQTVITSTNATGDAQATIAGTVTSAVAASSSTSVADVAAGVNAATGLNANVVSNAAATAAATTTVNSQANQTQSNLNPVINNPVLNPVNPALVNPVSPAGN